jgi:hyperosmotically inducible protein
VSAAEAPLGGTIGKDACLGIVSAARDQREPRAGPRSFCISCGATLSMGDGKPFQKGPMIMTKTGQWSLPKVIIAAALMVSACSPIEGRETTGQYVDDATISTKVRADLLKEQALKGFDIHVQTEKDVVQLSGFVSSQSQKMEAENIARGVSGVRGVKNDIIVR